MYLGIASHHAMLPCYSLAHEAYGWCACFQVVVGCAKLGMWCVGQVWLPGGVGMGDVGMWACTNKCIHTMPWCLATHLHIKHMRGVHGLKWWCGVSSLVWGVWVR